MGEGTQIRQYYTWSWTYVNLCRGWHASDESEVPHNTDTKYNSIQHVPWRIPISYRQSQRFPLSPSRCRGIKVPTLFSLFDPLTRLQSRASLEAYTSYHFNSYHCRRTEHHLFERRLWDVGSGEQDVWDIPLVRWGLTSWCWAEKQKTKSFALYHISTPSTGSSRRERVQRRFAEWPSPLVSWSKNAASFYIDTISQDSGVEVKVKTDIIGRNCEGVGSLDCGGWRCSNRVLRWRSD